MFYISLFSLATSQVDWPCVADGHRIRADLITGPQIKSCLCASFPEEDQREVGARPFSVWPRSRIKQESISKFCHVSYLFWYRYHFCFWSCSLEDSTVNYKYDIHHLDQSLRLLTTLWFLWLISETVKDVTGWLLQLVNKNSSWQIKTQIIFIFFYLDF